MKFYFVASAIDSLNALLDEKVSHILLSHAHFKKGIPERMIKAVAKKQASLMVDSGAFSNASKPGSVTLESYLNFVKTNKEHIAEYVTLDDLKQRSITFANLIKIREAGLDPMLVDHMWFPWHEKLSPEYKRGAKLCWGGLVSVSQKPSTTAAAGMTVERLGKRLKERAEYARLKPVSNVHLLGVGQRVKGFLDFFDIVDSVDSTTWRIASQKYGRCAFVKVDDQGWPKISTPHISELTPEMKAKIKQMGYDYNSPYDRDRLNIRAFKLFFKMVQARYEKAKRANEDFSFVAKSEWAVQVPQPDLIVEELIEIVATRIPEEDMAKAVASCVAPKGKLFTPRVKVAFKKLTATNLAKVPDVHLTSLSRNMHQAFEALEQRDSQIANGVTLDDLVVTQGLVLRELQERELPVNKDTRLNDAVKQTAIQTLIFDKKVFDTEEKVRAWLKAHGFRVTKEEVDKPGIDETGSSFRVRQRPPGAFQQGSFRTIEIAEGVKAVIGKPKERSEKVDTQEQDDWEEVESEVQLLPVDKADDDKRIVLGIVLEPGEVDSQKDTVSPEVIELAAHKWLAKFQDRGVMHQQIVNSKIEIYESFIARTNLTVGGQKVKKGSWLLMYHVLDDELWKRIKSGELTGFSMGGFARRKPLAAAA